MKNTDGGQLYTIEGFAAGLIMVITAYLVVNATSIYTAGDTHINDMQLETLGSDALTVMGTPMNTTENVDDTNTLQSILESGNYDVFRTKFLELLNTTGGGRKQDIQFNASYSCRNSDDSIKTVPFSATRNLTGGEHPVRVTKWVIVDQSSCKNQKQAVLVEVLLWRD